MFLRTPHDPLYVLDLGRPLLVGTPADVRGNDVVREAYLGRPAMA